MITRHILLGRITETDQLSVDQNSWQNVSDLPELIPEEMKLDLSIHENREKLRIAKMREDERQATDRRSRQGADYNSENIQKRSGVERRKSESTDVLRHREIKDQLLASLREKERESKISRFVWLTFILAVIALFIFSHP